MEVPTDREGVWGDPDAVGGFALEAVKALLQDAPVPNRRRWLVSDHDALRKSVDFEYWLDKHGLPAVLPQDVRIELNRDLSGWRSALPFSEAERRLLVDTYHEARAWSHRLGSTIRNKIPKEEVIDAGVRIEVSGRDLMFRWWDWRRGLGQFEGRHGVDQAAKALRRFAGRLVSSEELAALDKRFTRLN